MDVIPSIVGVFAEVFNLLLWHVSAMFGRYSWPAAQFSASDEQSACGVALPVTSPREVFSWQLNLSLVHLSGSRWCFRVANVLLEFFTCEDPKPHCSAVWFLTPAGGCSASGVCTQAMSSLSWAPLLWKSAVPGRASALPADLAWGGSCSTGADVRGLSLGPAGLFPHALVWWIVTNPVMFLICQNQSDLLLEYSLLSCS